MEIFSLLPGDTTPVAIGANCCREISPRSNCSACLDVCPTEALSLAGGKVGVDTARCVGCAACAHACPTGAVSGTAPKRRVLEKTLLADNDALAPHWNELLQWVGDHGIRSVAINGTEPSPRWRQSVNYANAALSAMNREPITISEKPPVLGLDKGASRRELFRLKPSTVATASERLLIERKPLSAVFKQFAFHQVALNRDACTLCGACSRICRSEAIRITHVGANAKLVIDSGLCTGCNLCADICFEHALRISQKIAEQGVEEHDAFSMTCKSCRNPFLSWSGEDARCHICAKRAELYGNNVLAG